MQRSCFLILWFLYAYKRDFLGEGRITSGQCVTQYVFVFVLLEIQCGEKREKTTTTTKRMHNLKLHKFEFFSNKFFLNFFLFSSLYVWWCFCIEWLKIIYFFFKKKKKKTQRFLYYFTKLWNIFYFN